MSTARPFHCTRERNEVSSMSGESNQADVCAANAVDHQDQPGHLSVSRSLSQCTCCLLPSSHCHRLSCALEHPRCRFRSGQHGGSMASASLPPPAAAATTSASPVIQLPVHSLLSLPVQLLELVLRFLPLRDKLLQLSRLSSAFPSLTPACFAEDGLTLRRSATRALTRSADLLALLSRVRQLSVYAVRWSRQERVRAPELEHCARLSFSVAAFSRLQSLSIELQEPSWYAGDESALGLQHVLAPLSSLPQLSSLNVGVKSLIDPLRKFVLLSDLALLSNLRSLRSLTLSLLLPVGSLSLLCSLPLEDLNLSTASFGSYGLALAPVQLPAVAASPAPHVSFSLRRLRLPSAWSHEAQEEVGRVLAAYGTDRIGRSDAELHRQPVQLEQVVFNWAVEQQTPLWWIPSLTALSLFVTQGTSLLPQHASTGVMLPQLRCVSLRVMEPDPEAGGAQPVLEDDGDARFGDDWLTGSAAECVGFVHIYSGQLLRLDLDDLPHLPAAAPIMQAAFRCQQLRRLTLSHYDEQTVANCFASVSFTPLPQLHMLGLRGFDLTTAQLTALLRACPAVEHVVLASLPAFILDLLPVIGRSCRRLRQLEAKWCAADLFSQPVQAQLADAEQAAGSGDAVFPQLVALSITLTRPTIREGSDPAPPPASPQPLQWLLRLLHSAPVLRYLRLQLKLDEFELPPFASLTSLRGFRLRDSWEDGWQRRFFYSSCWYDPLPDLTVWQPVQEADTELALASAFRSERALFRDATERFGGRTGREAFFAAIEARLVGRGDEVKDGPDDCSYEKDWGELEVEAEVDSDDAEDGDDSEGKEEKEGAIEVRADMHSD